VAPGSARATGHYTAVGSLHDVCDPSERCNVPTYEYACPDCGHQFEVRHGFSDKGPRKCPSCGKMKLRKVFHPVGIVFKGSGFYKTDSRGADTSATPAAGGDSSGDSSGGDTSTKTSGTTTEKESGTKKPAKKTDKKTDKKPDKNASGSGSKSSSSGKA
jgi:putative FmdB family regulatory protein